MTSVLREQPAERRADRGPFGMEAGEDRLAVGGEAVEALVAAFLAPFAGQQALRFEAAQQGIERAFLDRKPRFVEQVAQRVAVSFLAKRGEHGQDERAPAELDAQL